MSAMFVIQDMKNSVFIATFAWAMYLTEKSFQDLIQVLQLCIRRKELKSFFVWTGSMLIQVCVNYVYKSILHLIYAFFLYFQFKKDNNSLFVTIVWRQNCFAEEFYKCVI